ncbi:MAG: oligosaccharyl transferase, archaeosortase A system-associated, partial [Euryarchaeota archaeon]|nr:oligosaccharyl transferase, archaeosortase A system-associated [Euryarchaeota archaeon]
GTNLRTEKIKRYLRADLIITVLIIGLVVFYPPLNVSLSSAKGGGGPAYDWYESLSWMKGNTPDPGLDYYALYDEPPRGEDYDYPPEAYSIISWWDYGHWITRIAHRIPVANPFQQGIGGPIGSDNPGACVFFITKNEAEANEVADALDVRYVVSDFMMADAWNAFYNKFGAMTVWAGDTGGYYAQVQTEEGPRVVPSAKYFSTMEARLHIFDGKGVALSEEFYLEPLQHYRLVHESPSTIIAIGGQEIKFVKVFEYVKGARIEGTAPNGSLIEVSTDVSTNQGREFTYSGRTMADSNGSYEFIVPYSTEVPIAGGTNFDVFASSYNIRAGHLDLENGTMVWDVEKEVSVPEEAVMEGKTIRVDL